MIACTLAALALTATAGAQTLVVAPAGGGGQYTSIQPALDAATPGTTIVVRDKVGGYGEKLVFTNSGSAAAGWITLRA
ncbi:MAG: hypothetical protein AB8H80_16205, partial [Planctomycetota bacterium]